MASDGARHVVTKAGAEVHQTPTEHDLLRVLAVDGGQVPTFRQPLERLWDGYAASNSRQLRVYVNELRRTLEDDPARLPLILTKQGVGCRWRHDRRLNGCATAASGRIWQVTVALALRGDRPCSGLLVPNLGPPRRDRWTPPRVTGASGRAHHRPQCPAATGPAGTIPTDAMTGTPARRGEGIGRHVGAPRGFLTGF